MVKQFIDLSRDEGFSTAVKRAVKKIIKRLRGRDAEYRKWQKNIESKYTNTKYYNRVLKEISYKPLFSIVFPVYNKKEELIQKALDSITNQVYDNWQICISDGSTENRKETRKFLKNFQSKYPNKTKFSTIDKEGINIIENSNNALNLANGEYIVFMDCDDEISPNCLLELAKSINQHHDVEFIYSDFDHININDKRFSPSFWPDWSPYRLLSQMYTTHVTCYKKTTIQKLKGLSKGYEGAQDWDLALRFSETADRKKVIHIQKILYHWRAYEDSTAMSGNKAKDWVVPSQIRAIQNSLKRRGYNSIVHNGVHKGVFNTEIIVKGNPSVSIIIAFKDKVDYLKTCIESIEEKTKYKNYKIILIDNNSKEEETLKYLDNIAKRIKNIEILKYSKPFHFGKMYNWACNRTNSEYLLILNNDIKVLTEGWLEKMLGYAQLKDTGYVGAKLLYPDMRVQHGGVLVGHRGSAGHIQILSRDSDPGYLSSLVITRESLALTGACLLISKKKFFSVGGFTEALDPSYQDVDLGIKLYEKDLYNIYVSFVKLIHYESISRHDSEVSKNLVSDIVNAQRLRQLWPAYIKENDGRDPFYNENLSYKESDCRILVD